jgi:Rad3-related DNA helicase
VDVVLAPYSSLLLPDARHSLGIELQDSVVVFDEAHNLLDAINGSHSTAVTGGLTKGLKAAGCCLGQLGRQPCI